MKKRSFWKNFLIGYSSIFELYPPIPKKHLSTKTQSDEEAIRSDWEAIGNDLRFGLSKFQDEIPHGFTRNK